MKVQDKRGISLSESDTEYSDAQRDKIELASCPQKSFKCREHLFVINENYRQSDQYIQNKDYHSSIENLKNAFYKTLEIKESSCLKCAEFFRSTISESLENIHKELGKMSTGIFKSKRFQSSYQEAATVLKEFENVGMCNTIHLRERKKRNTIFYPKKNVS